MASSIRTGDERDVEHKRQLQSIVGAGNVVDEPAILEEHSRDMSFAAGRQPILIVKPKQAQQVHELVRWANQTLMPLIPISSGPPHFRGDTVPALGGVVVDLSGMNKILRVTCRTIKTPQSLLGWATATLRIRRILTCNGKNYQQN